MDGNLAATRRWRILHSIFRIGVPNVNLPIWKLRPHLRAVEVEEDEGEADYSK